MHTSNWYLLQLLRMGQPADAVISSEKLAFLISNYPILGSLASQLSSIDLFHLSLTCKAFYEEIRASESVWHTLRRVCLCDGHGLSDRKNLRGFYRIYDSRYGHDCSPNSRSIKRDEEIEVQLWHRHCPADDNLPCQKCDINICEECRYYPRAQPLYSDRRPYLSTGLESINIFCLCRACDESEETELAGKFLSKLCDCDTYKRWICSKCHWKEMLASGKYYSQYTKLENELPDGGFDENEVPVSKALQDHQFMRFVSRPL